MHYALLKLKIKNGQKVISLKLNCDQIWSGDKNVLITFSSSILELLLSTFTPPEKQNQV